MAGDKKAANPAGSKLLGLEVVRFICAIAVLLYHYRHFTMVGAGTELAAFDRPLEWLLSPFYRFGLFGVQLFWCISGFIFFTKYAAAIAERRIAPKRFFWLRFSRLYPLHLVTLLIVAALQPLYVALAGQPFVYPDFSAQGFLLQLGLADQWAGPRPMSFNGPIWSVSAEVFVYFGFFLLVRSFGTSRLLLLAAIGAGVLSMYSGATSPALICGAYFFAGGAAAQWLARASERGEEPLARRLAAAMLASVIALTILLDNGDPEVMIPTMILAGGPPLLLIAAREWPLLDRRARLVEAAGNLTYSTYLIHFPLQLAIAIAALATGFTLPLTQAWFVIAYLAATLALGRLVFLKFEGPAQSWIRSATLDRPLERAPA